MAHIAVEDANAWVDHVKLSVSVLDADLEESLWEQVVAQAAHAYETSTWVDESSTPGLIRKVLAMYYAAWFINRTVSEDDDVSAYAVLLMAKADQLMSGIAAGTIVLPDATATALNADAPLFYPNDLSSLAWPRYNAPFEGCLDRSLGPAKFSMGDCF
jgi:hypothetical protein